MARANALNIRRDCSKPVLDSVRLGQSQRQLLSSLNFEAKKITRLEWRLVKLTVRDLRDTIF